MSTSWSSAEVWGSPGSLDTNTRTVAGVVQDGTKTEIRIESCICLIFQCKKRQESEENASFSLSVLHGYLY